MSGRAKNPRGGIDDARADLPCSTMHSRVPEAFVGERSEKEQLDRILSRVLGVTGMTEDEAIFDATISQGWGVILVSLRLERNDVF